MKKYFILILSLLIFLPSVINAQWYAQYISSGNFINDISFINRYTGWACGSGGLILKTTNGGTNWFSQIGIGYLNQIHPVNDSITYACGDYIILKTTNGGNKWFALKQGPSQIPIIYGLWFNNENMGWFCGDRVALRTTNGGQTFIDSMFMTNTCNDIHFKNDSVGIIAAYSKMFRTTTSGVNWSPVILPSLTESPFAEKVSLIEDIGWTVSWGGIVFKTTNYGTSWDSISTIPRQSSNDQTYCIEFPSLLTGYAGGYNGKIFKTTDGGLNWEFSLNTGVGPFTSIYSFNDSIVWAVGGPGSRYIMNTVNGGLVKIKNENAIKNEFILFQNYPNPFNSNTIIKFQLSSYSVVSLKVYDVTGKAVRVLENKKLIPGSYNYNFDGSKSNSGVYFYTLDIFDEAINKFYKETKKFIIIK